MLNYLKSVIPKNLDPLQFAYRSNRSVEDAVSIALHNVLTHLDLSTPTYVRILFIDFNSAFNTILPFKLHSKLLGLGIFRCVCDLILHFLSARLQVVRLGSGAEAITSEPLVLNTGAPQEYVLSPFVYSLMTHDCVSKFKNCHIIKFADDTTVAGLIRESAEGATGVKSRSWRCGVPRTTCNSTPLRQRR